MAQTDLRSFPAAVEASGDLVATAQVAAVGVADPILGERVCACVVPSPGAAPTLEALRAHLRRARIAHYRLPERLLLLPAFPIVGDKVDRLGLAARAAAASC